MQVLYEDNHIIVVNKAVSEIVQGDKTGDLPLSDTVKQWLKDKYRKPGNVFCGVVHRLDRPVSGIVVFAKTSKALSRMSAMFNRKEIKKTYWAIVSAPPKEKEAALSHYLLKNEKQNKSYICPSEKNGAKLALLHYRQIAVSDRYCLIEVDLQTGRHHQIRTQLAHIGCPIKGDLKYGAARSNPDGGISLHSRRISFIHPVSQKHIDITAPVPDDSLWLYFQDAVEKQTGI